MMKTLKYIVLLTVMLVNVTPYIKDGKVEWKANEAAAQNYTYECESNFFQRLFGKHKCVNQQNEDDWFWGHEHECIRPSDTKICTYCNHLYPSNSSLTTCGTCSSEVEVNAFIYEDGSSEFLDASHNTESSCAWPGVEYDKDGYRGYHGKKILKTYHTHLLTEAQGGVKGPSRPEDFDHLESVGGKAHPEVVKGIIYSIPEKKTYIYYFNINGGTTVE